MILASLNQQQEEAAKQQEKAIRQPGNVFISACPGSGKTRVLTRRVLRGLLELSSPKQRIVAMTFTNRASDEIRARLDQFFVNLDQLWTGTIHSFALEWILRPYAPYLTQLKKGFAVADEFLTEELLKALKKRAGKPSYFKVNTRKDRLGVAENLDSDASIIYRLYQAELQKAKLIDYDDVLYYSFKLVSSNNEIASTLGAIHRIFCVDEIQDTQDLQYGILSAIVRASAEPPTLFFVGDEDQAIYESLGAVVKTPEEIVNEFGLRSIVHLKLTGNYRSTQRIVDLYHSFRPDTPAIRSLASYARESGLITFHNHEVATENVPKLIADFIRQSLAAGVPTNEVCVLAPHWWQVRAMGRSLVNLLPDVDFDAPGLSPLHCQKENFWFKVARLFLTTPSPSLYRTRVRWAGELLQEINETCDAGGSWSPRRLLRLINGTASGEESGLRFLDDVFSNLFERLGISLIGNKTLLEARELFFRKAQARMEDSGTDLHGTVDSFKKLFRQPSGVVVGTCHGVKGEEYETVIAFGLLNGYVPNWEVIIRDPSTAKDQESKLLYVLCSRAKKRLHLVAESGRFTNSGNQYEVASLLSSLTFTFDSWSRGESSGASAVLSGVGPTP